MVAATPGAAFLDLGVTDVCVRTDEQGVAAELRSQVLRGKLQTSVKEAVSTPLTVLSFPF